MPEATGQTVTYDDKTYEVVREGLAEVLQPRHNGEKAEKGPQSVFYNPIQQFNRDLSVLAIRVFAEDFNLARPSKLALQKQRDSQHIKRKREADDVKAPTSKRTKSEESATEETNGSTKIAVDGAIVEVQPEADGNEPDTAPGSETPSNAPKAPKHESKVPFRILDALSATGLRALRYCKEIDDVTMVTANDLSASAVDSIKLHIAHNKLTGKVFPVKGNAMAHMYHIGSAPVSLLPDGNCGRYNVIDLDPYGTAIPFLDAAVQSVVDGGLLCITCTDSGVFASGGYLEKTFSHYGGLPTIGPHSHEGGLRILLHAVATSAARYGKSIEPLLSLSIDYYVRIFVRVRRSPKEVKFLAGKTMQVYNCDSGCGAWTVQPTARTLRQTNRNSDTIHKFSSSQAPTANTTCEHCGFKRHLAGPMWGGPLHNPAFIQRMIDVLPSLNKEIYGTTARLEGMLLTARDETLLPEDSMEATAKAITGAPNGGETMQIPRVAPDLRDPHPFFFIPSSLAKVLHCQSPSQAYFRSALLSLNYRATRSHAKAGSIRTDAPWTVIWEIMREWIRQKEPIKEGSLRPGTPGYAIMRNARSNRNLTSAKNELQHIAETAKDIDQVKESLQAMLWRLTHPEESEAEIMRHAKEETNGDAASKAKPADEDISKLEIVFDEKLGRENEAKKVVRYQTNPTRDWGPQAKAKG